MPVIKTLTKRERLILYLTIILIILFAVYNFIVNSINSVRPGKIALTKKELLLKKNLKILAAKKRVEAEYSIYSGYIRKADSDEKEITALLKDIESLVSNSGLHIINLKPKGAKKDRLYRSYEVELDCESNIKQLKQFLSLLNKDPSLLKVKRFHLSAKENAALTLKANMLIARVILPAS